MTLDLLVFLSKHNLNLSISIGVDKRWGNELSIKVGVDQMSVGQMVFDQKTFKEESIKACSKMAIGWKTSEIKRKGAFTRQIWKCVFVVEILVNTLTE
jgi:hypothetical protein